MWAERDSNPRRLTPSGLQPDPVDRFGIYPWAQVLCILYKVSRVKLNTLYILQNSSYKPEPPTGFEPITYCLQNSSSTVELGWQYILFLKTVALPPPAGGELGWQYPYILY